MNHTFGLRTSRNPKTTNLATICKHASATVSDLGCLRKVEMQWQRSDMVIFWLKSRIPVKRNKLRSWKRNFGDKSAEGCLTYDAIAPWPDLTWPFFVKSCATDAPSAMQNFSVIHRALLRPFQKNSWELQIPPPPTPCAGEGWKRNCS